MHPLPVPACTCRPLSVPFLFCGLRNLTAKQALLVLPRHQYRYRFHTNTDTNNHTHTCLPCTCSWFLVHTHTHALHTHHPYLLVPVVGSQFCLTAIGFSITIPVVLLNLQCLPQEGLAAMMRHDEAWYHDMIHTCVDWWWQWWWQLYPYQSSFNACQRGVFYHNCESWWWGTWGLI